MNRFEDIDINEIQKTLNKSKKFNQEKYIERVWYRIDVRARNGARYVDICDMSDSFVDLKFVKEVYRYFKQRGFKVRFMPLSVVFLCDSLRVYW